MLFWGREDDGWNMSSGDWIEAGRIVEIVDWC